MEGDDRFGDYYGEPVSWFEQMEFDPLTYGIDQSDDRNADGLDDHMTNTFVTARDPWLIPGEMEWRR